MNTNLLDLLITLQDPTGRNQATRLLAPEFDDYKELCAIQDHRVRLSAPVVRDDVARVIAHSTLLNILNKLTIINNDGAWRLSSIRFWCPSCLGSGYYEDDSSICELCAGEGWGAQAGASIDDGESIQAVQNRLMELVPQLQTRPPIVLYGSLARVLMIQTAGNGIPWRATLRRDNDDPWQIMEMGPVCDSCGGAGMVLPDACQRCDGVGWQVQDPKNRSGKTAHHLGDIDP